MIDRINAGTVRRFGVKTVAVALGIFFALVVGIASLQGTRILENIAALWVISDELVTADAVVVLGGSIDVRPFAAADLYQRGYAHRVLVSDVELSKAERLGFIPSTTQLTKEILLKLGVPATAIVIFGSGLSSTYEEASAIREWSLQAQAKSLIVPTDLFATRRTQWVFDHELTSIGVKVMVCAYPDAKYTLTDWWRSHTGLIDFNNEVLKYLYYRTVY